VLPVHAAFCPQVSPTIGTGGGTRPNDAACGDLDGDGLPDIVTANDSSDNVTLLMSLDGTSYAAPIVIGVGDEPVAVAIGDIDGNGTLDVLTANHTSNDVSVLLNDGNGNLTAATPLPVGTAAYSITLAHLNSDEWPDIVTANAGGNSISVLLGTGSGAFAPQTEYPADDTPNGACVSDLDGDGTLDIATSNLGSGDVSIFWNRGDGTFDAAVNIPLGADPFDVACCDLDGVAGEDLVAVDAISNTISILFNQGGRNFAPPSLLSGGSGAFSVACHDMTGDSLPDVLMANLVSDDVTLFSNEGGGTLAASPMSVPIGQNPSAVTVCDVDNDLEPDIVVPFRSGVKVVWDACAAPCAAAAPPTPEPSAVPKNRYLSIVPGNAGRQVALRVTLGSIAGFPDAAGETRWVGPPATYPEEDSSDSTRTFTGAMLQCEPFFQDWGSVELLHVFGGDIVPHSVYDVAALSSECAASLDDPAAYSAPLVVVTGVWGDVAPLFDGDDPGAPQPDFNDISSVVRKFLASPDAPIKASAQLQPDVVSPNHQVNFKDIADDVSAFVGDPYPYFGPCTCPSPVTCGATACTNDTQCPAGSCIDGFCRDQCGLCTP